MSVVFSVEGLPIPQGSKTLAKAGKKVWLRDANAAKLKPWRQKIAAASDLGVTFDRPVAVFAVFYMPRPKKPRWWVPAVKPDSDKLARSLLDGMTDGGLLVDDCRVTHLEVIKRYEDARNPVGVRVLVMEDESAFRPDNIEAVARRLGKDN